MTTEEIKFKLLSELSGRTGVSTRGLCNSIFQEARGNYILRPGDHRMKQVYGYLKTLEKQGKVISTFPGYWRIKQ